MQGVSCVVNLAAMRVLYLSYDGLTDGLGRSQVLPYIFGLEGIGHEFTIVSFEKKERFAKDEINIRKLLKGKNIEWKPLLYTASPPILSTVYDVLRLRKLARALHANTIFDLIHCRSYITSLVGLNMKRKFGVRFVFDMRAFYADERVDGGLWNLKNPIFKAVYDFFKNKEKQFLEEADYTISLTEKGKSIIHSWNTLKGQPLPVKVIPCCADLEHFSVKNINSNLQTQLRQELLIEEIDLVITYLGSIGTWYMLPEMLDFFAQLSLTKPNAKLLLITQDDPLPILLQAKEKGITQARIVIRPASREEVPTMLSLAHAALFFIQPVFSKSGSSPTKHGEMLGMGLPVIANTGVGDVDSIISSTNTGLLIDEFTPSSYAKAIEGLDAILQLPKKQMRQAAEDYYSLEMGVERYNAVYSHCANQ
jgi:glycosyltransferase involved in cell wall biosynthesis